MEFLLPVRDTVILEVFRGHRKGSPIGWIEVLNEPADVVDFMLSDGTRLTLKVFRFSAHTPKLVVQLKDVSRLLLVPEFHKYPPRPDPRRRF